MSSSLAWQFEPENHLIRLTSQHKISWESFPDWIQNVIQKIDASLVDISLGADRVQAHFRLNQHDFLCHYEDLCEAIWIEAQSHTQSSTLSILYKHLAEDTLVATKHI